MFCRLKRVELSIIGVLWDAGEGRTVREVFEELYSRGPWSYNTVRTTMARMVKANVLKQSRKGRSNVYVPTVSREDAAAACTKEIITGIIGGKLADGVATVVGRMSLSAADVRAVKKAL
jgi:predicted transcriptional regulator